MKIKAFLILSIALLFAESGFTQTKRIAPDIEIKNGYTFVPYTFVDLSNISSLKVSNTHFFDENKFLTGMGYLLQNLKFSSPIDQFNAIAPFDFRAYEPLNFRSFSQTIQTNYLLQNSIQPIK